jgi:Fur family iron response transcriptional regulator
MILADILFSKGHRHVTAEMLFQIATQSQVSMSLATVYNTLNQLTAAGLLRRIGIDGSKIYFDTNVSSHCHFYLEDTHELVDVDDLELGLQSSLGTARLPSGFEIDRTDVVIRLRKRVREHPGIGAG